MTYKDFQIAENRRRVGLLQRSESVISRVREVNHALASLEEHLEPDSDPPPTIFVYGLPRSGTTLCQQLIAYCLDVGYINNVVARFWTAPVHGISLSRDVNGGRRNGVFESLYGKTQEPWGVHEFSYFWHDVLGIQKLDDLLDFGRAERVDWPRARRRVALISTAFGRPTLFKTDFTGEFAREFSDWMPKPLFVYVRRNLEDVALSLLQARLDYYGDKNVWCSLYPPNYADIKDLSFARQIAGQVAGLDDAYLRGSATVDPALLITAEYPDIVRDPGALLTTIADRLATLYGARVDRVADPPQLTLRRREATSEDEHAVLRALADSAPAKSLPG